MSKLKTACPKPDKAPARPRRFGSSLPVGEKTLARSAKKRKARKPSETLRIYGPPARRAWIASLPCHACASFMPAIRLLRVGWHSENAHTVTGGMGRKADAKTIVPLCHKHHHDYDHHIAPFDTPKARRAMQRDAAKYEAAWQDQLSQRGNAS